MEKEVAFGDILTPQEHSWIGSTPEYNPNNDNELYVPDGVLRGIITVGEAIKERKKRGFIGGSAVGFLLGIYNNSIAISLEEIDPITNQTRNDPKILGILDRKTNEIKPVIDEATRMARDLTSEYINVCRKKDLEEKLHLRPQSLKEKENLLKGEMEH